MYKPKNRKLASTPEGRIVMRVCLYARVSTKDKNQDVDNQLTQLRNFCTSQQGWVIVKEYCDQKSGKNGDRDGFSQMLDAASRREFDLVLFWSLCRFSREGVLGTLKYLEVLTSRGVGYKSYTEQYLDSCGIFKDAVISILATVAKQERVRLSERVIAGLERTKANGTVLGRPRVAVEPEVIKTMRQQGKTWAEIQSATGLSKGTAQRAAA
jgi:DNA invertase Pin-like site-specific DNA recombinase